MAIQRQSLTNNKLLVTTTFLNHLPWQITLLLLSILIPSTWSFHIGELRLTPYRIVLLVFFLPCFSRVFGGKNWRTISTDWLLLGYSLWIVLAMVIHLNFFEGFKSGGILVVESFGSYLLARSYIRNETDFCSLVKMLLLIVVALSVFTIPEALTGNNFLQPRTDHIDERMGLSRAFGPFDHPILYGMFCASIFSLALYIPAGNLLGPSAYKLRAGWVMIATFMSVSSGALAAVVVQFILAVWNKLTLGLKSKWRLFSFLLVLAYITIDLLSSRTPMRVILHRLTFSAETAYARLIIWEWGTEHNVVEHPWFGIGFAEWVRPSWMYSSSIDNYWLVNMVRYGLPSFVLLAAGVLFLLFAVKQRSELGETAQRIRTGWGFSMIGIIIAGCTVHFWNSLHVWFFFMLGSGAWLACHKENRTS